MEYFFLTALACFASGCRETSVGSIGGFETLQACITEAQRRLDDNKRYATRRNTLVYLFECKSQYRTVKVPQPKPMK